MMFTLFDIIIITILSISSILGIYRGMIHITINLLGFIASIVVAVFLYSYIRVTFSNYIANDLVTSITSGVVAYIFSLIVFTFITSKILLLFEGSSQGIFDRFLGLIIGLVRGGLMAVILFAVIAIFTAGTYSDAEHADDLVLKLSDDKYPDWLKSSVSTPYLEEASKNIILFIPQDIISSIEIPKRNGNNDEDLIDKIKNQKDMETTSSIEIPLDQDLKSKIDELLPENESE